MRSISHFFRSQRGLVTMEWIAIAAVAFVAALAISFLLLEGADDLGGSVAGQMSEAADQIDGGGGG